MKTSLILLWIAVAGVIGYTIYQSRQPPRTDVPVQVNLTLPGVRVPITSGNYEKFEQVLSTMSNQNNTNGNKGMCVNILYQTSNGGWETVNGPPFDKGPQAVQPDGSMHVTQSILYGSLDQLNDVMSLLGTDSTKPTTIQAQCP
ncbi:MAG: hypothetical protein ACREIW_13735 [Chthoniobacterales bacterium]